MNKAFFLDRDGTINVDTKYLGNPNEVKLLPGSAEAIKKMNDLGYYVIVISNQSGVARGYFGIKDVELVNERLNELLKEYGAHIDKFYYCPHLSNGIVPAYSVDCDCRKPKLGMFQKAIEDFSLDPQKCYACGDKPRDVEDLSTLGIPGENLKMVYEDENPLNLYEVFDWDKIP